MTLAQWQTVRSLEQLYQQLQHAVDDLLHLSISATGETNRHSYRCISQIQVWSNDLKETLEINLTGVSPTQIAMRVTPTQLILSGEVTERVYIEGYCDFTYTQPFQDRIPLPYPVHPETVVVEYLSNWLIISLPKAIGAQTPPMEGGSCRSAESMNYLLWMA
jgi:HSP20 family molecular chaperone IbpA